MLIRAAQEGDAASLTRIYGHYVEHTTATFDLEAPGADYWLAKLRDADPTYAVLVAVSDADEVLGFAYAATYRPRPAYAHTRETSIYLAPDAVGRGVGRTLYRELLTGLDEAEIHTVLAVIAQPNAASEALHLACGFEEVGRLPEVGQKFGTWIDTCFYARPRGGRRSS